MKKLLVLISLFTSILWPAAPLSKLDEFNVYLNFSPKRNIDRKNIKTTFQNSLSQIGTILSDETNLEKSRPILFFHLDGITGSVKVLSDVIVPENGFKTACSVWEYKYQPESMIPIETPKGIAFEKRKAEFVSTSPEATIEYMVKQFESEYKKMNPNSIQPVFFFHIRD